MWNSPATTRRRTHWWLGLKRRVWPHIATLPERCASATTASPSASASHSGISTCTCLPASRQACACAACICVGVHRITASTSAIASASARSVATWAMRYLSATARVLASSRPTSETTSTPSICAIASRCLMPNAPAPASATLIVMPASDEPPLGGWSALGGQRTPVSVGAPCSVLQDEVADRGVRRRHMVEAVHHLRCPCLGHRTARDQPHHQLDPLAAGL